MKKALLLFILALCSLAASAQETEKAAVRVPLENYIKAHATGDP